MKFSLWTAAAVLAAATILITVTVFIATPEMPVDPTTASSPPGIQDPTVQKKTVECGAIQARIDAAGQPGWDGLAPELQSDIRQATACTFVGDAKKF